MFPYAVHTFALIIAFDTINISCSDQQSYEVLKGFFAKSVDTMPDGSVSSPMKDDEKHLIQILLESFASNRLGAPNCKVTCKTLLSSCLLCTVCMSVFLLPGGFLLSPLSCPPPFSF